MWLVSQMDFDVKVNLTASKYQIDKAQLERHAFSCRLPDFYEMLALESRCLPKMLLGVSISGTMPNS